MRYYFKETETISKILTIIMAVVLIIGIIGGVVLGMGLRRYVGYADYRWTSTGIITMISMWVFSIIISLMLYITKHQIELTDMTAGALQNIQAYAKNSLKSEQE